MSVFLSHPVSSGQLDNMTMETRRSAADESTVVVSLTGRKDDGKVRVPPRGPDLEGYLEKLKRKTSLVLGSSWNRRYFVVLPESGTLVYYGSKEECIRGDEPSGRIDMRKIRAIRKFDDTSFQVEAPTRTFHLRADSKAGLACWLMALQQYLKERQDYDRWKASYDASRR